MRNLRVPGADNILVPLTPLTSSNLIEPIQATIKVLVKLEGSIIEMPAASNQLVEMYRGDNKTLEITVTDAEGIPINLTGADILFSVKKLKTDTVNIFQKSSDVLEEIDISDPTGGVFDVYIVPVDTQELDVRRYVADAQVVLNTGKVYTVIDIVINLKADVTRP